MLINNLLAIFFLKSGPTAFPDIGRRFLDLFRFGYLRSFSGHQFSFLINDY